MSIGVYYLNSGLISDICSRASDYLHIISLGSVKFTQRLFDIFRLYMFSSVLDVRMHVHSL